MSGGPWSSGFSLGFGPASIIDVTGTPTDSMQLLGYSTTESLFYDESNSQSFYLQRIPPLVPYKSVFRVSPLYARNWLVISGSASNQVYNPFGTNNTRNYSNTV